MPPSGGGARTLFHTRASGRLGGVVFVAVEEAGQHRPARNAVAICTGVAQSGADVTDADAGGRSIRTTSFRGN